MPENLGVPLQGDRDAGEHGGAHQGCQVPFRPPIPHVGLLLRRCSGKGLHLAMTGDPRGFSRVAAGFSSYDGEFMIKQTLIKIILHWEEILKMLPVSLKCNRVSTFYVVLSSVRKINAEMYGIFPAIKLN